MRRALRPGHPGPVPSHRGAIHFRQRLVQVSQPNMRMWRERLEEHLEEHSGVTDATFACPATALTRR